MSIPSLNPFANMNEEIEGVVSQLSEEQEPELPEVIEDKHNQLLQNIATQVGQSLQLQGAMERVIAGLTDESTGINLTSEAKLRLKKLQGILSRLNQEQNSLTGQLKTSATSLRVLQERTRDLRRTAATLRVTVLKAPPKYSDWPHNILAGGIHASKTIARKGKR